MTDNKHNKQRPDKKVPKNGARYIAARALQDILEKQTPLDVAMTGQALFSQLEFRDRAFARLIVATTLRRLGQIDIVLSPFISKEPPPYVKAVLRTGAAQMLFLETPAYAVVGASVALLKRSKKTVRAAGMANAVLRRVSEQGQTLLAKTRPLDNIPKWLADDWAKSYGEAAVRLTAQVLSQEPPLDITLKGEGGDLAEQLEAQILPGGTLRRDRAGAVPKLPGFKDGSWWVQDVSAALPVRLLGDVSGQRVLDMCAAPGGKTMQLAAGGADVYAVDKSEARLWRVDENLARTGLTAKTFAADAARWRDPDFANGGGFDAVLLDAPCSATGTFRRRPDVLQVKTVQGVQNMMRVQEKLLMAAARHVKPGGTLIYCTCSLQAREGEDQVAKFTKNRSDFRLNSILSKDIFSLPEAITPQGCVRILPHFMRDMGGMDGFFIARFTRC